MKLATVCEQNARVEQNSHVNAQNISLVARTSSSLVIIVSNANEGEQMSTTSSDPRHPPYRQALRVFDIDLPQSPRRRQS